jgi:hypothetical protein
MWKGTTTLMISYHDMVEMRNRKIEGQDMLWSIKEMMMMQSGGSWWQSS